MPPDLAPQPRRRWIGRWRKAGSSKTNSTHDSTDSIGGGGGGGSGIASPAIPSLMESFDSTEAGNSQASSSVIPPPPPGPPPARSLTPTELAGLAADDGGTLTERQMLEAIRFAFLL